VTGFGDNYRWFCDWKYVSCGFGLLGVVTVMVFVFLKAVMERHFFVTVACVDGGRSQYFCFGSRKGVRVIKEIQNQ